MGRGRPKAPLALTGAERQTLEQWASRPAAPPTLAERARILLACADGETNKAIAVRLGLTPQTVGKWRSRFLQQRVDGLLDEPRSGAPRRILDADVARVLTLTLESAAPGGAPWSTRSLAVATGLSQSAISRIWRAHGVRPRLGEAARFWADPAFVEQVVDVAGIYADPPTHAIALCVAAHALPCVERVRPSAGREGELSREGRDPGAHSLLAGLRLPPGGLRSVAERRARALAFRSYLDRLEAEVPRGLDLHLLLARDGTLESSLIQSWLAAHPRFQAHPIPPRASFEELVERWLQIVGKRRRDEDVDAARRSLAEATERHRRQHPDAPAPFVWVKESHELARVLLDR